jgi:hypothetical protein
MVRRYSWLVLVAVLLCGAVPLSASSTPPVAGQFAGIELCEQAVCGAAYFTGLFAGQFGSNPFAVGSIVVSVIHDPLPPPNAPANINGGAWQIKLLNGKSLGGYISGGTLINHNGDGTFLVTVNMVANVNGSGTLTFDGVLSHNTFPPTISGRIKQ